MIRLCFKIYNLSRIADFMGIIKKRSGHIGENMITAAQEWFNEGLNEGEDCKSLYRRNSQYRN